MLLFLLIFVFIFGISAQQLGCIINSHNNFNGLMVVSTGNIVGTEISIEAAIEFRPTSVQGLISTINQISISGGSLGEVYLQAITVATQTNQTQICSNSCNLQLLGAKSWVYMLLEIMDNQNTQFHNVPIIELNYINYLPDLPNLVPCNTNQTIRHFLSGNNRRGLNVTTCLCCDSNNAWKSCSNFNFPTQTTAPATSKTGVFTAPSETTPSNGMAMPTSSVQNGLSTPNCSSPSDNPFVNQFCSLNSTSSPSSIANNITSSIYPSNLTGYDIFLISQVMYNITNRKDLTHDDFSSISIMTDTLLAGPHNSFVDSNNGANSTLTILSSVYLLMKNSPHNSSYLSGSHVGMASFQINCSGTSQNTQMMDNGDHYSTSGPSSDTDVAISIPTNAVCQNQATRRLFYSIYRNTKLFVGTPQRPTNAWPKNNYIQKLSSCSKEDNHFAVKMAKSSSDDTVEQDSTPPNGCKNGFWYGDNKVMTGTLIEEDNATAPFKPYDGSHQVIEKDGERQKIVVVKYSKKKITKPLHGTMKLTWWMGYTWSDDTCTFSEDGDFWISECDHLTDFTLVIDGVQKDPSLCSDALMAIGYIFNIGSLISLFILNMIFILHKVQFFKDTKLARILYGRQNFDLFTSIYNMVLFAFFFMFTIFSDEGHTSGNTGCRIVAGINYWLLLCCIIMTIFQAWRILKFFAWNTRVEQVMTWLTHKFVILGGTLGFPSLMALILGVAAKNFYNREDEFCWIRSDYVVPGVVIPLTLLVINGIFCMVIVSFRLFPKICGIRLIRTNSSSLGKRRPSKDRLIALFFMQITLGVPWILQYLTLFTPSVTAWHYLFTIVNGSQGIILLLIYAYKRFQAYKLTRQDSSNESSGPHTAVSTTRVARSSTKETSLFSRVFRQISNGLSNKINISKTSSNDDSNAQATSGPKEYDMPPEIEDQEKTHETRVYDDPAEIEELEERS